jgi:hypothetical protein
LELRPLNVDIFVEQDLNLLGFELLLGLVRLYSMKKVVDI